MLQPSPLTEISSQDLRVRRNQGQESVQGTSIENRMIKIARMKESLGPRVAYPSVDEPQKIFMMP
jgi:hypothetical protein